MPSILIVDDLAQHRELAASHLKDEGDWRIELAENGRLALEALDRAAFDVVLTDIRMPELDGWGLVQAIRRRYPSTPVVLMTSEGSDEVAWKALQEGAASYIAKQTMTRESLRETLDSVVAIASRQRDTEKVLGRLRRCECAFVLENDPDLIPAVVHHLQHYATRVGLCDETERVRIGVALDEALVNALYHGNLEVSSELRDANYHEYLKVVRMRKQLPPYAQRRIRVNAVLSAEESRFVIRDEGPGFDPNDLPDPRDPANLEKLGGRGILLMRTFMNEVVYNEEGNEVTMVKRQPPDAATGDAARNASATGETRSADDANHGSRRAPTRDDDGPRGSTASA